MSDSNSGYYVMESKAREYDRITRNICDMHRKYCELAENNASVDADEVTEDISLLITGINAGVPNG